MKFLLWSSLFGTIVSLGIIIYGLTLNQKHGCKFQWRLLLWDRKDRDSGWVWIGEGLTVLVICIASLVYGALCTR